MSEAQKMESTLVIIYWNIHTFKKTNPEAPHSTCPNVCFLLVNFKVNYIWLRFMIFLESVKMAAKQELDYFLQIKSDKSQKGRRHPNMDIQITEYSSNVTRKSVFLWLLIVFAVFLSMVLWTNLKLCSCFVIILSQLTCSYKTCSCWLLTLFSS